jgi:hypothetical protein
MIDDWWKVDFIPPARATVDFGRDTKALLEIVRTGAMSTRRFAEMHGMDEEAEEDAAIAAAVRRKTKCEAAGLGRHRCFPARAGITRAYCLRGRNPQDIDASPDEDEADGGSTPPDSSAL